MAVPHNYFESVINRQFDEDGSFGVQCVDGFKHFCRTVCNFNISRRSICYPSNLAYSIWDNYESLGLNNYFDKVPSNQMVDGDWAIWSKCNNFPSSHIAMFRKDNGNGTGVFLGQNQGGVKTYTQKDYSYSGIRGALRPKVYHQSSPAPQPVGDTRNYINLSSQADTWRFYDLNVAPVKGNEKGFLKPSKFGGLSYYIYEYRDNNTTAVIQTRDYGKVKIYIKHELASVTVGSYKYGLVEQKSLSFNN